jgi:hypothetical protein
MEGFDYGRAKIVPSIPNEFDVNAMIRIGRRAPADNLPNKYREMELPSPRRPLHEIVFEGVSKAICLFCHTSPKWGDQRRNGGLSFVDPIEAT